MHIQTYTHTHTRTKSNSNQHQNEHLHRLDIRRERDPLCVCWYVLWVCEVYESDVSLYEVSLCVYNTNMQQQNDIATPTTAKNNKNILTAIVIIYYIYIV